MKTLNVLYKRKDKLEEMLYKEKLRLHAVSENMGWGAGMRRTKCTPSFTKEDKILSNLKEVQQLIINHPDNPYSKN
jgi:hypothetical protein